MITKEIEIRIDKRCSAVLSNDLGSQTISKYDVSTLKRYLDVDSILVEEIAGIYVNIVTKKKKGIKSLIKEIFLNRV